LERVAASAASIEDIDNLYRRVREEERKAPSLFFHADVQNQKRTYPHLSTQMPLRETLTTVERDAARILSLDAVPIVSYSKLLRTQIGLRVDIKGGDLDGHMFLDTDFFSIFDMAQAPLSDVYNIAKAFFSMDGNNHVAIVQYLPEGGCSREHYHSLDEIIVQLAGSSILELRPIRRDAERRIVELAPGDIEVIPADNLHRLQTIDGGSIAVPLKQTMPGRSDHHYVEKSVRRLSGDIEAIMIGDYASGEGMVSALDGYYGSLSPGERRRMLRILDERIEAETNRNVKDILLAFRRGRQ
jgi:mannose-6-phosphate isomerase-like protein (cupin superfamily)